MTKIVKFLKPYMGATVAALFFSLFNNLMQLILPAMMALMINTGIGDGRMGTVQLIGGVMAVLSADPAERLFPRQSRAATILQRSPPASVCRFAARCSSRSSR